jgi:hypothetical protein
MSENENENFLPTWTRRIYWESVLSAEGSVSEDNAEVYADHITQAGIHRTDTEALREYLSETLYLPPKSVLETKERLDKEFEGLLENLASAKNIRETLKVIIENENEDDDET